MSDKKKIKEQNVETEEVVKEDILVKEEKKPKKKGPVRLC